MMINYKVGDVLKEDVDALVNSVNCVGVMGRGVALQFKKRFPDNFKAYAAACRLGEVKPGRMFVFETGRQTNPKYVINFPTKRHWRGASRIDDIESGLQALVQEIERHDIRSIAIPPLGSGLGGLDWAKVRLLMERAFQGFDGVRVMVYEPVGSPPAEVMARNRKVPTMTFARAALVSLMHRYLASLLDPTITLLEVHKLMYFMQAAGEPLKLKYAKSLYGPYAENLRHLLNDIEGHFISGYADGGDRPDKEIRLVPGALEDARTFLGRDAGAAAKSCLDRTVDLVSGFESPAGLELLATVHWVVDRENAGSVAEVIDLTYAWGVGKRRFSERQIKLAVERLAEKKWIMRIVDNQPASLLACRTAHD